MIYIAPMGWDRLRRPFGRNARRPRRAEYRATWDALATDPRQARIAVAGTADDGTLARSAAATVDQLERTVGIEPGDTVVEIGCGYGRIGRRLAERCNRWIGTDVSGRMLEHAATELGDCANVELVPVSGWDLEPLANQSADMVYCTVVFMHIDEWERWSYVREAARVLRPGGRLYIDNYNLAGPEGWEFFDRIGNRHHPLERPAKVSRPSTATELITYLDRGGFEAIDHRAEGMWVYAWGAKPS